MRYASAPVSTFRLQLEPDFTLDDAVAQVRSPCDTGDHAPLPVAGPAGDASAPSTATTSSTTRRSPRDSAATPAFARLVEAAHAAGLGVVVDVVPNHMTTPTPLSLNRPLWSVLREGRQSAYATWFDVDWDAQGGRILMPVLGVAARRGARRGRDLALGEHEGEPVVQYYDHVFPLAPGTDPGHAAGRAPRRPALPPRVVDGRGLGAELPSLLRRHLPHRGARRGARGVRRHPRAARRRHPRPAPSTACASTTPTASPTPRATSRDSARRPVTRGSSSRRSSRGGAAAARMADGRDDRVRRPAARRRPLRRPGRCAAARRPLDGAARRATGPRGDRHGVEAVGRRRSCSRPR